jgi:hypothetical protein
MFDVICSASFGDEYLQMFTRGGGGGDDDEYVSQLNSPLGADSIFC